MRLSLLALLSTCVIPFAAPWGLLGTSAAQENDTAPTVVGTWQLVAGSGRGPTLVFTADGKHILNPGDRFERKATYKLNRMTLTITFKGKVKLDKEEELEVTTHYIVKSLTRDKLILEDTSKKNSTYKRRVAPSKVEK